MPDGSNFEVSRQFVKDAIEEGIRWSDAVAARQPSGGVESLSDSEKYRLRSVALQLTQVLFYSWASGECECPATKAGLVAKDTPEQDYPQRVRLFAQGYDAYCAGKLSLYEAGWTKSKPMPFRLVVIEE